MGTTNVFSAAAGAQRATLRAAGVAAIVSSIWLLVYFTFRYVLGPINFDEVFFSHVLWLQLQGKRQYVDFYSQHLPTYFAVYSALLPRFESTDLSFISIVRYSNLLIVFAYVGLLFWMDRRKALFALPLMLLFIVISRMVEIRTDTLGLLLFNAGWVVLIRKYSQAGLVAATLLAFAGALCSARGLVMGVGFAVALLVVVALNRDLRGFLLLCGLGAITFVATALVYFVDPDYLMLVVRSSFLDPAELLVDLSVKQRLIAFDRTPQVFLTGTALIIATWSFAMQDNKAQAAIIAIATTTQLLLILFDPSPFPYVYAWAVLPTLAGLGLLQGLAVRDERPIVAAAGSALAAGIALMVTAYPLLTGRSAETGSNYRLIPDSPLSESVIEHLPTSDLIKLILTGRTQHSLANQLATRRALCHRVDGPVLSVWQYHPICLPDSAYFWYPMKWPNIWSDGDAPKPTHWFEAMFESNPPSLFIWATPGRRSELNPWSRGLLRNYVIHDGYALKSQMADRKLR